MLITILPPQSTTNASLRLEHGKREEIRCESRSNFLLYFLGVRKYQFFAHLVCTQAPPSSPIVRAPLNLQIMNLLAGVEEPQLARTLLLVQKNPPFAIGIELSDSDSCYPVKLTCLFTEKQRRRSRRTPLPPRAPSALRAPSPPRFSSHPASRPLRPGSASN